MKIKRNKNGKIIVAMSGGLDSSVAAALLKRALSFFERKQRIEVIGIFMRLWSPPGNDGLVGKWNRCCSPEAEKRAKKVARILKIPFYVLNFEKEFKKKVVDYFLREYKAGRTPNPCIVCNKEIKFGLLLEKARGLGADFVATGHYVRLGREVPKSKFQIPKHKLLEAKDKEKDQSYFLWQLNQKQLKHTLFPICEYTKKEVRDLAKEFELPVVNVPESQEICFVAISINDFLSKYLKPKPGKIVDTEGKTIGKHQGLYFYTIGQRKGIKLAAGPWYVLDKDSKRNILIVTKNEKDLGKKELITKNVNWISGKVPKLPLRIKAKIRYRSSRAEAKITEKTGRRTFKVVFSKKQRAVTPGQSVVFYSGEELLGGGIIEKSH